MLSQKNHVIRRPDGTERRLHGYRPAPRPLGTKSYAAKPASALPAKVDLRPKMTPVENQGGLNSCVANAVAGAYEYLAKQHLGDDSYDVSRLFVYYNARKKGGIETEDQGSIISDAIESLKESGACSEQSWPYDEGLVSEEPEGPAYDEAARFLVESSEAVPCDLNAWKSALAEGYPIVFGCLLFDSFDKNRRGKIPMPTPKDMGRKEHGGHSMLCVGYSDRDKVFIVRNSWGEAFGDKGYCYMPYDYLMHPDMGNDDSWIIRRLDNFDPDQETWSNDEESILTSVEEGLASIDDAAWGELLDAMGETPLETRLALVLLSASGADGEISEKELGAIGEYLRRTLQVIGSDQDPSALLDNTLQLVGDQALMDETIELLGQHLPADVLASLTNDAIALASADGLGQEEMEFANSLAAAWQIGVEGDEAPANEGEGEGEYAEGEAAEGEYGEEGGDGEYVEEAEGDYEQPQAQ